MGVNQFADLTEEEFLDKMTGLRPKLKQVSKIIYHGDISNLPESVDWRNWRNNRNNRVVTDVKDQGECGSCWAFSAVASIEGQHAINTGNLVSLSEQNLVDCFWPQRNLGCSGGLMNDAFQYVVDNGGIDTESSYPYMANNGRCKYNSENIGSKITGYTDIPSGDESKLQSAVANIGPISVVIHLTNKFRFYSSSILNDKTCSNNIQDLNHAVAVIGYGTENGLDYWIVKNSWGLTFGENGYIRMARNMGNQCGIATAASYPNGVTA